MAPKPFTTFIRDQWAHLPDIVKDLTGKTVIVVGANVGLGFDAAKKFATMNPERLILACRSQERGDEALKTIKDATGCTTMECWTIDLSKFKSVSQFADRFEKEGGGRLDILVENAGVAQATFIPTSDGWESTLQVNHLGTALLAFLLLPYLAKQSPSSTSAIGPRITIVSSGAHTSVDRLQEADQLNILEALNNPENANMAIRYHVSKLLNVFFTRSFAAKMKASVPVSVDAVSPGLCETSIGRSIPFPRSLYFKLFKLLLARSSEYGSRTLTHAALWGAKEEVHGKYLDNCSVGEVSDFVISEEGGRVQERLWHETIEILERLDPRVKGIVAEYLT